MALQLYSLEFDSVQTVFHTDPIHAPVSFSLQPGEWAVLYGPSGSGKTTLLRSALGFTESYRGTIRINGDELSPDSASLLREIGGYLPQQPYIGEGTVRDIIQDLITHQVEHQELEDMFPRLGLPAKIRTSRAERLSGGELQRLGLALLLCRRPQILFLDEPSSGLDPVSRNRLIAILKDRRVGGIITSHDQQLIDSIATRIIHISPQEAAE
ncbi:MAG: ABC transporter ATP-binding protein [Spirochaeta sp.]